MYQNHFLRVSTAIVLWACIFLAISFSLRDSLAVDLSANSSVQITTAVIQPGNKTLKFTNTINQPIIGIRVKNQAVPLNGEYVVRITGKSPIQATVVGNSPTNIIANGVAWNELAGLAGVEIVFNQEALLVIGDEARVVVEDGPDGKDNSISLRLPEYYTQEPYRVYPYGGLWDSFNNDGTHTRVLIQLELSNLSSSATVLSAQIHLFCFNQWYRGNNPAGAGVVLHRILKSWHEGFVCTGCSNINSPTVNGVTGYERWFGDNMLTGGPEDWAGIGLAAGVDYEAAPQPSTVLLGDLGPSDYWNPPDKFFCFEVTQLVQGWLSGTYENYGVLLMGNQIADDAVYGVWAGYAQLWRDSEYTGNTTQRPKLVVKYESNRPPIANAGPDQTVEATSPAGAVVTLDGSGSTDPDNDALIYTWRENGSVIATDQTSQITLALGSHSIELTVDDGKGGVDTDEVIITVKEGLQMFVLYAGKYLEIRECDGAEGWVGSNGEIKVLTGTPSTMAIDLRASGDITIYRDNTINGGVISNAAVHLDSRSTVTGAVIENAGRESIPLPTPIFTAGGNNVSVPKKGSRSLAPGSYGKVAVGKMAKLYLRSGQYNFTSLCMDRDSDILMDLSEGLLQVNIVGSFTAGDEARLTIAPANSGSTREVQFTVLHRGIISLGNSVMFMGTLLAPYAQVKTSSEVKVKGAIYADLITGIKRAICLHHSSPQTLPKRTAQVAEKPASAPQELALLQNYPNPFNPETEIRFQLPEASHVVVRIFNTLGAEIRTLVNAPYEAGYHRVLWDGKDEYGNPVVSGVYFYQLRAGEFSQVKKMSLLR